MKATFTSREKNDVKFSMEFSAEEFENAQINAYKLNKDKFMVDGFRKGKAPRSIIEKKYGEGIFFDEAIDELFQVYYPQALAELSLEVIDRPAAEFGKIAKGEPLTVTITVPCYPVVEVKGYKGVKIEKVEQKVAAKDVDMELESMRARNARIVSVERPAKEGDVLLLNYSGFVGDEQFEGGTAENQELKLGSNTFIPGFEDQLVGVTPGEKKDVVVTFPEEYHAPELAGKEAVFHCLVHEVKEEQLPELNDDFAQDVSEFDTIADLKKDIKKRLTSYAKAASEQQMQDAGLKAVVEANEVDVPQVMVEDEIDRKIEELNQQLQYQGLSVAQYLQYVGRDMQDFRKEVEPDALQACKTRILLNGIVEQEKIKVTEEELEEEIKALATQYAQPVDKIKEMIGLENLTYFEKDILVKKAIEFIYSNAEIVDKKETKKAAPKKEAKEPAKKAAPKTAKKAEEK